MAIENSIKIEKEPVIKPGVANLCLKALELFINQNPVLDIISQRLPDGTTMLKIVERKWPEPPNYNPAKRFLRGYRALLIRNESLVREIERRLESATGTTARLKPINVQNGAAAYDRMAEDVARIVDAEGTLGDELQEITKKLKEILTAIESVPDEMQKTVLTLRYIEGLDWPDIQERISYERTQTLVIHGKALVSVNKWMEKRNDQI